MMKHAKKTFRWNTFFPSLFGTMAILYLILKFHKIIDIVGAQVLLGIFLAFLQHFVSKKKKAKKESKHTRKRKGELWVLVWIGVCVYMVTLANVFPGKFNLPEMELNVLITAVIGLYLYGKN